MDRAIRNRRLEALERRCHVGLSTEELATEVLGRLRTVMTIDAAFFASVDPATLLFTSATQEEPLAGATPLFLDNEFGQDDVNKFTVLAAAAEPVRSLDDATRHRRESSARYRDIMAPLGLGDELRAVLRVDATTWGVLCLHREDGPGGFSADDAKVLSRVAPHIALGLRRATVLEAASGDGELGEPGVVVLDEDLAITAITPGAEQLMAELTTGSGHADPLPAPIHAVARRLVAFDEAAPPRLQLRTATGRWLSIQAARLNGERAGIVVVLEPARPADALPVKLLALGLTRRESQIAQLVVRGCSTQQIVEQLHISHHTVQDHLKSVFDKTGVRSRRELVAQLLSAPHRQ